MALRSPYFSIVSPVYRAELLVDLLVETIIKEVTPISEDFEIILVDDGSPDKSWERMEAIARADKRVKALRLSRNFGQHYAITAGLDAARGEWIIVMDCDLQDKPSEIKKLYNKTQEGYDIVLAQRIQRRDKFIKRFFSKSFYRVLSYMTGVKQDASIANFGIYHHKAVDAMNLLREPIRYFPSMVNWVGFKKTTVPIEHGAREVGSSNYNFKRLIKLAMDIMLASSDKPLKITVKLGFYISALSFVFAIYTIIRAFRGEIEVLGYASLMVSVWLLSGIVIMLMGVVGLYVGKSFEGIKNRPIYIISEKINAE
jgi:polyisoprenyl-phosphate glycosyltransferase